MNFKIIWTITLYALISSVSSFATLELDIGREYIKPLKYPKLTVGSRYVMLRRFVSLDSAHLRLDLANQFEIEVAKEINLYKFMNAGFHINFNLPQDFERDGDPLSLRLALFAKPFIPLGERITIFFKVSGGLSAILFSPQNHYQVKGESLHAKEFDNIYGDSQYARFASFGFNGSLLVGMEFFPFSRMGIAVFSGIDAELGFQKKQKHGGFMSKLFDLAPPKNDIGPSYFSYLNYWLPIGVNLHFIL